MRSLTHVFLNHLTRLGGNGSASNGPRLSLAKDQYCRDVQAITTYMLSLAKTPAPVVDTPHGADFVQVYRHLQSYAMSWFSQVKSRLEEVPGQILGKKPELDALLADACEKARALSQKYDPMLAQILGRDLANISQTFSTISTYVQGTLSAIKNVDDSISGATAELQRLAADVAADIGSDRDKINRVAADAAALRDTIDRLSKAVIADGAALAAAVALCCIPFGFIVGAAAVAAASTRLALDTQELNRKQAALVSDQAQLSTLDNEVALMLCVSNNCAKSLQESEHLEPTVAEVIAAWGALARDVQLAVDDITKALTSSSSSPQDYKAALEDVTMAQSVWSTIQTEALSLNVGTFVSLAHLTIGMSEQQVRAAVDSAEKVDDVDDVISGRV